MRSEILPTLISDRRDEMLLAEEVKQMSSGLFYV